MNLYAVASRHFNNQFQFMTVGRGGDLDHIRGANTRTGPWMLFTTDGGANWVQLENPNNLTFSNLIPNQTDRTLVSGWLGIPGNDINDELILTDVQFSTSSCTPPTPRWYICGFIGGRGIVFSIGTNSTTGMPDNCDWRIEYLGLTSLTEHSTKVLSLSVSSNGSIFCVGSPFEIIYSTGSCNWATTTTAPNPTINLGFGPLSIKCDPGNNDMVVISGEDSDFFAEAITSRLANVTVPTKAVQQLIPPSSPNNWRTGPAHSFEFTDNSGNGGYIITDFGRLMYCSTMSMNPDFSGAYRNPNIEVILSPNERLYCISSSPDKSKMIVGGTDGNLWTMQLQSGIINSIINRNLTPQGTGEIYDMLSVGNRVWMVGERGLLQYVDVNGTTISSPTMIYEGVVDVYSHRLYDFHGICRQNVPPPLSPVVDKLWVVGQNGMIMSGDISIPNLLPWATVPRSNIHLIPSSLPNAIHKNEKIHLHSIAFSSDLPCMGYAVGGNTLILRTTDGGENWYEVNPRQELNPSDPLPEQNLYKVIYNQQRFIIVGESIVIWKNAPILSQCSSQPITETWNLAENVPDGTTPTNSTFVDLLDNAAPNCSPCSTQRHQSTSNIPTQSTARYVLRDVAVAGDPNVLIAVGYLSNANFADLFGPGSSDFTLGLLLTSTDNGVTWKENLPIFRNSLSRHSGGGYEKNNARARLFGVTTLENYAWVCGSTGYVLFSQAITDIVNRDFPDWLTPANPLIPTSRWGTDEHPQMNGQTLRTMNTICAVSDQVLLAAGSHGTIIATIFNNGGLGKPHSEEQATVISQSNSQLLISPNPISGSADELKIAFTTENSQEKALQFSIINSLGQTLSTTSASAETGKGRVSAIIPVTQLSSGFYYVCVKTTLSTYCEKVIIHR